MLLSDMLPIASLYVTLTQSDRGQEVDYKLDHAIRAAHLRSAELIELL